MSSLINKRVCLRSDPARIGTVRAGRFGGYPAITWSGACRVEWDDGKVGHYAGEMLEVVGEEGQG